MTLTVHIFGIVSLMGKQFVDFQTKLLVLDCYLPVLPAIQVDFANNKFIDRIVTIFFK